MVNLRTDYEDGELFLPEYLNETNRAVNEGISTASQAAEDASGYLADLQEAITGLPDGQAVSAQVAINETDIAGLKSNIVVDLSVRYSTSYANLSAALNALNSDTATDAAAIKKAGVSVKFINSSTNKYEQWNLKASSWSTNTSDWGNTNVTQASEIVYNGQPLSDILPPFDNIDKESTESEEEAIIFETDGGVQVGKIDANGADFVNLKKNGVNVATENQIPTLPTIDTTIGNSPTDANVPSTKAVKDYVDENGIGDLPISGESTVSEDEEIEIGNDTGTQSYVKAGSYGLKAKKYLNLDGEEIIPSNLSSRTEEGYDNEDEQIWSDNEEKETYAKVGSYGLKSKSFKDLEGNDVINGGEVTAYGSSFDIPNAKRIKKLEAFGDADVTTSGNQLLNDVTEISGSANQVIVTLDSNGYWNLSGTASASTYINLVKVEIPANAEKYTMSMCDLVNPNNVDWHCGVYAGPSGVRVDSQQLTRTYDIPVGTTSVQFGIFVSNGVNVSGMKFRIMINVGATVEEYERFNPVRNIIFPIDNIALTINGSTKNISLTNALRCFQIPVYSGWNSTGSTVNSRFTQKSEFTYSDDKGNIFVADSIAIDKNVIRVVQRVGSFVYDGNTTPVELLVATDGTPINFYSNNVGGLVVGATIYYKLDSEVETVIGVFNYPNNGGISISTDADTYLYLTYNALVTPRDKVSVQTVSEYTDTSVLTSQVFWGFVKDGNNLYAAGFPVSGNVIPVYKFSVENGVVSYVSTVNVGNNTHNKATCIALNGNYLYLITRSQASANVADSYGEEGHFFVLDKNLNTISDTALLWKGCDVQVFKGYAYVMEQMGRFEVFDISTPTAPVRVYGYDGANSIEYLQDGTTHSIPFSLREHQHASCWSKGSNDYMAVGGFEHGVHFYDITTPALPVYIGSFNLDNRSLKDKGMYQSFTAHAEYPLAYCTIGKASASKRFAHNTDSGICVLPIIDTSVYADTDFAKDNQSDYLLADIPEELVATGYKEGDSHPSRICMGYGYAFVNNGYTIAVYKIKDNIPEFCQLIELGTYSTDNMIFDGEYLYTSSGMASRVKAIKTFKIN